jgi:DNA-binding NarL/FixJ family response regulator
MPKDAKRKARVNVRKAQAEFERDQERAQRERAKAREARQSRFAQARKEGLTMREIAEETGLGFGRVAEIIRGE